MSALSVCRQAAATDWFVEAHYADPSAIARVAPRFQHLSIDRQRQVVRVDTDEDGMRALSDAGFSVQIDEAATAQMHAFYVPAAALAPSPDSIPGFACYRTVEETYATMDQLVSAHPTLVSVEDLGPSWSKTQNASQGYTMRALRITNLSTIASDPDRPRMVIFGSIHAREYTPAELLTRFGEWLVNGYGTDPQATWLVDHTDIRLVLQANPDGRKKAEAGLSWRKNTDNVTGKCTSNANNSGIDLNRNFPFHWNITAGQGSSGTICNETYRGPSASSEPETRNLVKYVAGTLGNDGIWSGGVFPDRRTDDANAAAPDDYAGLFFDIHSYSQLVLWPWGDTSNAAPNGTSMQAFGRRLAWFNNYTPEQIDSLYPADGTTDDTFYGLLGVPAYTIELGIAFFESCSSFTGSTYPQNVAALKYSARSAWRPYQLPLGPDAINLTVDHASVVAGQPVHLSATIDDSRYNQSNGTQTTYAIRSAAAYVDHLPWQSGSPAIVMTATDGVFNSTSEGVAVDIDTTGMPPGRHLIYVQGTNSKGSGGTAGTPDAIFLDVTAAPNDIIFQDGFGT